MYGWGGGEDLGGAGREETMIRDIVWKNIFNIKGCIMLNAKDTEYQGNILVLPMPFPHPYSKVNNTWPTGLGEFELGYINPKLYSQYLPFLLYVASFGEKGEKMLRNNCLQLKVCK